MKRVFRTDVIPGTITNIERIDTGAACACYKGVGELAGQDECTCTTVDLSDPSGPKFRSSVAPSDDKADALRDHLAANAHAGGNTVKDARDAMVERNRNAYKRTPPAPSSPKATVADANESEVDRARREMNERNANAWKTR